MISGLAKFVHGFHFITEIVKSIGYVLDNEQNIVAISEEFTSKFSLTNKNLLIGKRLTETDLVLLQFYKNNAETFAQQNAQVISTKQHHIFLEIIDIEKFSNLFIVHKYPIVFENKCIGIYVYMRPFALQRYSDLIFCSYGKNEYCISPWTGEHDLTQKQLLVLFLFLRNYSYTEISSWLSAFGIPMSSARVTEHLENLKAKFKANNKSQLKERATLAGFPSLMPKGFLKSGSYLIDNYLTILKGYAKYPIMNNNVTSASLPYEINSITSYYSDDDNDLIGYIDAFTNYYQNIDEAAYLTIAGERTVLAKTNAYVKIEDSYNLLTQSSTNLFLNTEQGSFLDILHLTT